MENPQIKKAFTLTIFGASGDLAKLKLFPSIYELAEQGTLPKDYQIIGYARTKKSRQEFQEEFAQSIKEKFGHKTNQKILDKLLKQVHYFSGQYNSPKDFKKYRQFLQSLTKKQATHIAYFSVPPSVFQNIIENLGETRSNPNEDLRLVLEKPFGEDEKSARELFHFTAHYFNEEQVYLLDHYLGKHAVQSILHLRHSNRLLNVMMKGPEISNIQITAAESLGVDSRVGYFDTVGTIKDMFQSHLLQILALLTMSIPITTETESIHRERENILSSLKFIESNRNVVTGQYQGYQKQEGVKANSKTETFAAMRLFIDRESWYKTPIYIRSGKKLHEKHTYIVIEFKKFAFQSKQEEANRLIIELQPQETINIQLINKSHNTHAHSITTSESIACPDEACLPEHAQLILDVIQKRRMNFVSFQEIIATWKITDSITNFLKKKTIKPEIYQEGSEGPQSQNQLTAMDNFQWFDLH